MSLVKKPHIYFKGGYWRVSPKPILFFKHRAKWRESHDRKMELNYKRSIIRFNSV